MTSGDTVIRVVDVARLNTKVFSCFKFQVSSFGLSSGFKFSGFQVSVQFQLQVSFVQVQFQVHFSFSFHSSSRLRLDLKLALQLAPAWDLRTRFEPSPALT